MYLGAVFEACFNELAACWKCTANNLNFSEFELNCSADEDRTLTVGCKGANGVINESTVACVYDAGPRETCQ